MGTDEAGTGGTQTAGSINFELLAESAADVLVQADATGVIEWASLGAAALAVTDRAALTGQTCASLVHKEDRAGFGVALRAALADGRSRTDVRMGSSAAGWGWHSVVIRRMALAAGSAIAVSGRSVEPRLDLSAAGAQSQHLPAGSNLGAAITQARTAASGPTVLLIDDEPLVRAVAARMLRDLGYAVVQAGDAGAVLALGDDELADVDLLLTDVVMPGIGGLQLAEMLDARRPGLPTLFMSGYVPTGGLEAEFLRPATSFLTKPFTRLELADALSSLLGDRAVAQPRTS
jgi:CheY-like chemotaxis protein